MKEVMPYWTYLDALQMAAQVLAYQPFESNQARADAMFDLAARLFVRYHDEREKLFSEYRELRKDAGLEDNGDAQSLAHWQIFADFLREIRGVVSRE